MIDIFGTIETQVIVVVIARLFPAFFEWLKSRKKPSPNEVKKKVEELAAEATKTIAPDLSAQDQHRLAARLAELTLPSFKEVVEYSPNTRRVLYAARKMSAAKRKGAPPKKRGTKKATAKIVVPKRVVFREVSKRR